MNGADAEVFRGHRIHVVARRRAVEHVGFDHGVVALAAQRDAVIGEHVHVEFHVRADLGVARVLEQRAQRGEHALALELLRRAGIAVRQRHVRAAPGLGAERDADDLCPHVIEPGGLGIEGEQRRARQALEPSEELGPVVDQRVVALNRIGAQRRGGLRGRCH